MSNFDYDLGTNAVDLVTGFKGIITGRAQYLTGCNRYNLQAKSKDGAEGRNIWIDENALKQTKGKKLKIKTDIVSGGPNPLDPK